LILAVAAGAAAAAPQDAAKPLPMDDSSRYERCLALVHHDPEQAFATAEDWRKAGGGFPAEHCAAVALVGLKRYQEAAQRLEALAGAMMQAQPWLRAEALEQAGQAWLLADRAGEAKSAFDAALQLVPDDPDLLIDRAQAYAEAHNYWPAIDDLNQALELEPNRADALIFRASAYRRVENGLDLALADVERALTLAPDAVPGLLERGNIRELKGDLAGARADWIKVETLAPASAAAAAAKDNLAHLAPAAPKQGGEK